MQNYDCLKGKVAIVTGGAGGIGRAIALGLAEAGADVVLASRKLADLQAVAQEISQMGRRALAVSTNVRYLPEIDSLVKKSLEEFGKIDILVTSHGVASWGKDIMETDEAGWDRDIDINLKGTYFCCKAVVESMMARKTGVIVNFASWGGINPRPRLGAYCVAKAGVIMLTRLMAIELGSFNIRVNAVAPGFIKTGINISLRPDRQAEEKLGRHFVLGRLGEPEDVSKVVLFLASDDSAYVTGQTILVDGGGMTVVPYSA